MRLMLTTECQCKLVWPSPNPTVSSRCCFPSTQQEGFRHFSALFAGVAFLLAKAVIVTQAPYPLSPTLNTDPESSSEVNVKIFLKFIFILYFGCSQLWFGACSGTLAEGSPCSMLNTWCSQYMVFLVLPIDKLCFINELIMLLHNHCR